MAENLQKPFISVIIPARDEGNFIGDCIDSVISSSEELCEKIEIVVVLNRCSDQTEEIALQKGAVAAISAQKPSPHARSMQIPV